MDINPASPAFGCRKYEALAHSSAAWMICDLWRMVIEQFENGTPHKIVSIMHGFHGMETPQATQIALLSSAHIWSN
jgi:hypothetical protein